MREETFIYRLEVGSERKLLLMLSNDNWLETPMIIDYQFQKEKKLYIAVIPH